MPPADVRIEAGSHEGRLDRLAKSVRAQMRVPATRRLVLLFVVGFVLRLLIAPHVGFGFDLGYFSQWAVRLETIGMRSFYAPHIFVDYLPGALYVFAAIGKISSLLGGGAPGYVLLKIPAMAGDLVLAWIVGEFAVRIDGGRSARPVRTIAASAVLFNPAVIFVGAVWGQIDVIPITFVVAGFLVLLTGRHRFVRDLGGVALLAIGGSIKPQTMLVLPVVAFVLVRRYADRSNVRDSLGRLAAFGAVGFGIFAATGIPFGLTPLGILRVARFAASYWPVTSLYAFNLWGAVGFYLRDATPAGSLQPIRVLGVPALYVGLALFVVGTALVLRRAARAMRDGMSEGRASLFAAAAVGFIGFAVLTRLHERYLILGLACSLPLVAVRRWRPFALLLSGLFVVNLYLPFVVFNQRWNGMGAPPRVRTLEGPLFGLLYGGTSAGSVQNRFWSLIVAGCCVWAAGAGWRALGAAGEGRQPLLASLRERARRFSARAASPRPQPEDGQPAEPGPEPRRPPLWSSEGLRRWLPVAAVVAAVVFNLVVLRAETQPAQNLNDGVMHEQMARWAERQIEAGRVPLDGWYRYFAYGSAHFHHYQSLPHILTAYAGRVFGVAASYRWSLYLLLALWPLGVYWAARIWRFERWASAGAAVVCGLIASSPGYGFDYASFTWQGWGLWPQLWAMWLLPFAWALGWRAVASGRGYARAAAVIALTIACHFIVGYLALLSVGVWVLVARGEFFRRVARAAMVGGGALLAGAWVIVPVFVDRAWSTRSFYYTGDFYMESWGAWKVLGWLFTGRLFDNGRFPALTILVAVGFVECARRWRVDARARSLLSVWFLSFLLFFGRPTLGPLLKLLPGSEDLQIHRFIVGVDLGAILLAGIGLVVVVRWVASLLGRIRDVPRSALAPVAVAVVAVVFLSPPYRERAAYHLRGAGFIAVQRAADAGDGADLAALVDMAKERGGGRIYAGRRLLSGEAYRVASVPAYAVVPNRDADSIGYTYRTMSSLSIDIETDFNEHSPAHYELFNVRYVVTPSDKEPLVPAEQISRRGRHVLWETTADGYLEVVDTIEPIEADRWNLVRRVQTFLASDLHARRVHPVIDFSGSLPPRPTATQSRLPEGPAGSVEREMDGLQDGVFGGEVVAHRDAVVLLRSTFHPRWRVLVDGRPATTQMIAPSFVGVAVPEGSHSVFFYYVPYGGYRLLFALGGIALLALYLAGRGRVLVGDPDAPAAGGGKSRDGPARARDVASRAVARVRRIRAPVSGIQLLCWTVVAVAFGWRLAQLRWRGFDADELEHTHATWSMVHGLLPYRDFFQQHPPALYVVLAPIFYVFNADVSAAGAAALLTLGRQLMWVVGAGIILLTFEIGRRWRDATTGAIGAALLATTYIFHLKTLEIRPDVPATALLLGSIAVLLPAMRPGAPRLDRRRLAASGLLVGSAVTFSQKPGFALVGMVIALMVAYLASDERTVAKRALISFAIAAALPMAVICAYFAARGALPQLFEDLVLVPMGWKDRQPLFWGVWRFAAENPVLAVVGVAGFVRQCWTARPRGDLRGVLLTATTAALVGGWFLGPARYRHYFILFLPFLALFAAALVVDLVDTAVRRWRRDGGARLAPAAAIGATAVVVLLTWFPFRNAWPGSMIEVLVAAAAAAAIVAVGLRSRWGRALALSSVVAVLVCLPVYRLFVWDATWTNTHQLAQMGYIIETSSSSDIVLDGVTGAGSFRRQAFSHGFLPHDVQVMVPVDAVNSLRRELVAGTMRPAFVVLDQDLSSFLGPEAVAAVRSDYVPTGVEPILRAPTSPVVFRPVASSTTSSSIPFVVLPLLVAITIVARRIDDRGAIHKRTVNAAAPSSPHDRSPGSVTRLLGIHGERARALWRHPARPYLLAALAGFVVYVVTQEPGVQIYNQYVRLADSFLHGRLHWVGAPDWMEGAVWQGRRYSHQGVLPGILLTPFVALFGPGFDLRHFAAIEGAVISALVWSLASRIGLDGWRRIAGWAFPIVGTTIWYEAKAGRTWGVAALGSVLFLFAALNEYYGRRRPWLVGLFVGLAAMCRPPASLALLGFVVALRHRREIVRLLSGFAGPALAIAAYNLARFGTPLFRDQALHYAQDPYRLQRPPGQFSFAHLPFNLHSWFLLAPRFSRGWPVAHLSYLGTAFPLTSPAAVIAFAARRERWLWVAAVAVVLPAAFQYANGFDQFGIRYLLDAVPFLTALIFIALRDGTGWGYRVLLGASVAINLYGVIYTTQYGFAR